jgi:DUF4097 and DUF4098 domain-containing protein YvlB
MQVFETPGSVSLQIQLPSGRVGVTTADEPRTTVEVIDRRGSDAADKIEVSAEPRGDGHLIRIEHRDRIRWGPIQISWGGDIEVRVTCPPGSNLEFASGSADLRVDGDLGDVSAKTASGNLKLGDVARKCQVKTASGDVEIGSIGAGGQIGTVSGDLTLASFEGELRARSVSGAVRMRSVRGPLQLSTTSGDVVIEALHGGEFRMQTVSGDVRIGVARGTRVWIDATSVSGDLSSELGLEDEEPAAEAEGAAAVVPLQVKTVSGDVQIVHAAEAFTT